MHIPETSKRQENQKKNVLHDQKSKVLNEPIINYERHEETRKVEKSEDVARKNEVLTEKSDDIRVQVELWT